jgi:hypothetical protein
MSSLKDSSKNDPRKQALVEEVERALKAYYIATSDVTRLAIAKANGNAEAIRNLRGAVPPANTEFLICLTALDDYMRGLADAQKEKIEGAASTAKRALVICLLVVAAIGLAHTSPAKPAAKPAAKPDIGLTAKKC